MGLKKPNLTPKQKKAIIGAGVVLVSAFLGDQYGELLRHIGEIFTTSLG